MTPNLQEGMVGGSTTLSTNNNIGVGMWKGGVAASTKRSNNKGFCIWLWAQTRVATNAKRINTNHEGQNNTKHEEGRSDSEHEWEQ